MDKTYIVKNKKTGEAFDAVKVGERVIGEGEDGKRFVDVDFQIEEGHIGGITFELTPEGLLSNERYTIEEKTA